ncbi:uncharacterized protein N7484_000208 [Penicillium longicatenatum]|uniref:uncharacterized protein n=1 Tax=Penicillium longicatenatum TaxID=1561947 RepID=UPI00254804D2|nr:uncharacterized protein N7484_000208 [Penicillium longicatenatum]KAJ5660836.1 hypothetical protein N7484_000208 [Penicillium longicatenatum]
MAGESIADDAFDSQLWFTEDLAALTSDKTGFDPLMNPAPFVYGLQLPPSPSSWGSGFPTGEGDPISLSLQTPADRRTSVASHQELTSLGPPGEGVVLNPLPTGTILSQSSSPHSQGPAHLPQHPADIRQALQIISDYPAQMLSKTSQSPFIHYRLAHGSRQGMPEPIAIALACVGMKLQSQSPAKNFVCNTFRDQREKIIAELPTGPQSLEDICSYLHALSIYQIEGLLSSNRYEAPFSSAELHHEYLIKMTRRLGQTHHAILLGSSPETQWETWFVNETFRRTFYLVFLIHHLLGASKRLMPAYFEPLLALAELRLLRLPCGEEMWNAPNAEDWTRARQHLDQQHLNGLSLGEVLDAMTAEGDSLEQSLRVGMLGELPRLIISVVNST